MAAIDTHTVGIELSRGQVEQSLAAVVAEVRDYTRSQIELWWQVPLVAQRALEVVDHHSTLYSCASNRKLWCLQDPQDARCLSVDLNDAELVYLFSPDRQAADLDVLRLMPQGEEGGFDLGLLDAGLILAGMRAQIDDVEQRFERATLAAAERLLGLPALDAGIVN